MSLSFSPSSFIHCSSQSAAHVQTLTLENDYDPTWDYFPDDVTVDVFDDYGTEALGFPTAYQQCGASPVEVTYTDLIEDGSCFAEKILTRTFKAVDICNHETTRSQIITITNSANDLPLGEKSLASIYGRERARIGNENNCLWDLNCGIQGVPTNYQCGTAPEDEFSEYSAFLASLNGKSLNLGPSEKSCACSTMDETCDKAVSLGSLDKQNINNTYFRSVLYGVQVVQGAELGSCSVVSSVDSGGNTGVSSLESFDCTQGNNQKKQATCMELNLVGTNDLYNLFSVDAEDIATKNIILDAPTTSIALINVQSIPDQNITIGKLTDGVRIVGLPANNILWNFQDGVNVKLTETARVDYNWYGSILNPLGLMQLTLSQNAENSWQGQLFCNELNSNSINFECGHFAGFANCAQISTLLPTSAPTKKVCLILLSLCMPLVYHIFLI